jgi:hypothetical protein
MRALRAEERAARIEGVAIRTRAGGAAAVDAGEALDRPELGVPVLGQRVFSCTVQPVCPAGQSAVKVAATVALGVAVLTGAATADAPTSGRCASRREAE